MPHLPVRVRGPPKESAADPSRMGGEAR